MKDHELFGVVIRSCGLLITMDAGVKLPLTLMATVTGLPGVIAIAATLIELGVGLWLLLRLAFVIRLAYPQSVPPAPPRPIMAP